MSDLGLKAVGIACAAGSVWFAVHMFTHQDSGPRVNAMEDFAIFAQPNRIGAVEAAVRAAAQASNQRQPKQAISIDMTPVGSAPPGAARKARRERRDDVRIAELNDDNVLLETRNGYRRVRVGDESAEVGKIISIRRLANYWIVVASERSIAQLAPVEGQEGQEVREGQAGEATAMDEEGGAHP